MTLSTSRRAGLRSETSIKMQTRQSRRARNGDNFQSIDRANAGNRRYPVRSGNRNWRKSKAVGKRLPGTKKQGNLKGVVSGENEGRITTRNADHLCRETDLIQIKSGTLTTSEDMELSDDWKSSEASSENQNNRRPTNAAAVSPTASLCDSDSEPRSLAFDDNKVKPISLDDIDDASEIHFSRRINIDLIKELSFDSDSASKTVSIPTKDDTDEENNGDDGKEIVWTKKIATITSSSGNLIEDLDADCDESSTGSMSTIIGSEQSSSVGAGDDLEGIFRLKDEIDGENDDHGDDCGSVDSINSKRFVLFGDEYDGKRRQIIGPKTSRINPMTGKRSLTDDMQEWRNTVLSSWTLLPPKEEKKYNTRKAKRERVLGQHAYQLRNTTDSTKLVVAANIDREAREDSRELQNIAPYNRPGIRDLYGAKSIFNTANEATTKQEEVHLKQLTIKVRIGSIIFVPDDEKDDGLQVAARIIKAKDSSNKPPISESDSKCEKPAPPLPTTSINKPPVSVSGSECAKSDLPLATSAINRSPVPESGRKCNKPVVHFPANDIKPGSLVTRSGIEKNNNMIESTKTNKRPPSSLRERGALPQKRKKRKTAQGLQTAPATLRATTNRCLEKNPLDTFEPCPDEKLSSVKRKQKKTSCRQRKSKPTKPVQKNNEMPLDLDRTLKHSTRIAKKFLFNPTRRDGRDKLKLFFGTIVSKRIDEQTDNTFWHVVYDDGDEEDYDESELEKALNLYRFAGKRWDENYNNNQQNLTGEIEIPKDVKTTDNARELRLQEESPTDSISQRKKSVSENKRQAVLASSERNKPDGFNQGQQERNRELQNCCVELSSDECDISEETSDDDSVHVVDMVDLTKDENIGNVVDIVDLTVNTEK